MPRTHDMGGQPAGPIDRTEHQLADWERLTEGLNSTLAAKGIKNSDEGRRVREDMPSDLYIDTTYYERWVHSIEVLLVEKGILTADEIEKQVGKFEERWGQP